MQQDVNINLLINQLHKIYNQQKTKYYLVFSFLYLYHQMTNNNEDCNSRN